MAYYCDIAEEYADCESGITHSLQCTLADIALSESGAIYGSISIGKEVGTLQSGVTSAKIVVVAETASLQSAATHAGVARDTLGDETLFESGLDTTQRDIVGDEASLQSAASSRTSFALIDTASLQSGTQQSASFSTLLGDVLTGMSGLSRTSESLVGDEAVLQSGVEAARAVVNTLGETAALQSALSATSRFSTVFEEAATFASDVTAHLMATQTVVETAYISGEALLPPVGAAWSAATDTFGMSRYENYPFVAMAVVDGVPMGVMQDGLYSLVGQTDEGEGIPCSLTTGVSDMGGEQMKRIAALYSGQQCDGDSTVTVTVTDDSGNAASYEYPFETRLSDAPRNTRVLLGKGLRGRYWQFSIANDGASSLTITDLSADVAASSRRV